MDTRRNIVAGIVYYFFTCIMIVLGCNDNSREKELFGQIHATATISPDTSVHLNSMISLEWDRCLIVHPYTSIEQLSKKYSLNLEKLAKTNIETRDDVSLLCISKDGQVAACYAFPRNIYTFDNAVDTVIQNNNTKIRVQRIEDNEYVLKIFN